MNTIQKTMGWLVMAAALTITTTACSSDDMLAGNNEPALVAQAPQKVHITVGAGVGTSGKTRSTVDYNTETKERTLKFTTGDKLYVRAVIEEAHDDNYDEKPEDKHDSKIMAGFLTIDPATISADGKSAQFTGDLTVYKSVVKYFSEDGYYDLEFTAGSHTFTTADPLAECVSTTAQLVHESSESNYSISDWNYEGYYEDFLVKSSVNEMMTSYMWVDGNYDKGNHKFVLSCKDAVFNLTVSGLTPNNSYALRLLSGETADDYDTYRLIEGTITADASGKATFVITEYAENIYMKLLLVNADGMGERKQVAMGQKDLKAKVYNITCTATDYVVPNFPTVTGAVVFPDESGDCVYIEEDPADVTISGSFTDYYIFIENGGTVRLNNITASYDDYYIIYGESDERDLTLELTGDNSLSSKNYDFALYSNKNIKLRSTGSSATLTVTAQNASICGFNCSNYVGDDPNKLAAEGYTVTRSAMTDNGDGTYTWTYTVTNPAVPEGAINGKFSVSSTKQVYFSKGNLRATTTDGGTNWTWTFATNQWDYIGGRSNGGSETQTGNNFINGDGTVSANGTVDLFGWVGESSTWTGAAQYGISNSTNTISTDGYGKDAGEALKSDWGTTMGAGWRTLTKDEWYYLFNTRESGSTVNGTSNARYTHATINTDGTSVNGMILFPEGVTIANSEATSWGTVNGKSAWGTKCTSAQWTALAAKGCVFLPAAGYRTGSSPSVHSAGSRGYYWSSSSPSTQQASRAYYVNSQSGGLDTEGTSGRSSGYSVRLVRAVE